MQGEAAGGGSEVLDKGLAKVIGMGDDEELGRVAGEVDELDEGWVERGVEAVFGFVEDEKRGRFRAEEGSAEGDELEGSVGEFRAGDGASEVGLGPAEGHPGFVGSDSEVVVGEGELDEAGEGFAVA